MKNRLLRYIFSLIILTGFFVNSEKVMGQTVTITSANLAANGITASPVLNGQQNVVVFGFTITVSGGSQNFNQFVLGCTSQYFSNAKLYRATTGSTSFTGSQQIATLGSPNTYISLTGINETITNTSRTYFLVADINVPTYVALPTNIRFNIAQAIGSLPYYTAYSSSVSGVNFTVASPPAPVITYAANTNGVTSQTTLYSGQTGVVIYGVTITTNVATTISNPLFYFLTNSSNPTGNLSNIQLVYSTSTSGPGTAVGATAYPNCSNASQSGNDLIIGSSTALTLNPGTYYNFYIIADISSTTSLTFQLKFDELKSYSPAVDYYNTVAPNVSYTFTPAVFSITGNNAVANGITQGAIAYNQTGIVLFGFSITGQGSYTVTQYQIGTNANPSSYFTNGKLYRSTDTHFSNAVLVSGAAVNYNHGQNTIQITGVSDVFTGSASTTYNYFVVGDFLAQTSYPAPATFTIGFSTTQALAALNQGTSTSYNSFTSSTSSFSIINSICWTGSLSNDFSNKLNYLTLQNGAVSAGPTSGVSVIIGDRTFTNAPTVGADITVGSIQFKNTQATALNISAGKELTVTNGITLFPGNSTTVTGGKLTLSSGSISTISSTAVLTLGASTTVTNNGTLTLQSDATSSASIASIPSTSSIVGSVNVERWITGGAGTTYRGYRLLSSPVNINNSTTGNIDLGYLNNTDNVNLIGALTGGPGGTNKGFSVAIATPAIYLYREDVIPGTSGTNAGKNKGITAIYSAGVGSSADVATGTNIATSTNFHIPVGNGYIFYNIGSTGQPGNATSSTAAPASYAITAKGYLNQGDITFKNWYTSASTLSYTNTLPSNKGFNMVGNPYACTLNLNTFYNDNSSVIQPNIFVLNNINPGQAYISYNASTGIASDPHASQYIASGQGMFVQAKSASALIFKESQKAPTLQLTGTQLLMGAPAKQAAISGFYMKVEQDSLINDYCGIYFDGDSDDFDNNDAVDLDGASPKVYMSSYTADGKRTGINSLSDYKNGKTIKLYVSATTNGLYKLKIEQIRNIDAIYDIWLKDNYKNDSLDLRSNNTYSFNIIRSDAASMGANRFEVVIRKKSLPKYQFVSLTGSAASTGVSLTWKTQNEYNFTGFTVERLNADKQYDPLYYMQSDGSGTYTFIDKNPSSGINTYRIKQDDIDNNITYSADVSVDTAKPNSQTNIIVYPSSATSLINVKFTNPLSSPANVIVVNAMGDIVNKKVFNQQQDIIDVSKLKTGVYFVRCTDGTTQKEIGLQRFIKL